jgi:hypothetical protein
MPTSRLNPTVKKSTRLHKDLGAQKCIEFGGKQISGVT